MLGLLQGIIRLLALTYVRAHTRKQARILYAFIKETNENRKSTIYSTKKMRFLEGNRIFVISIVIAPHQDPCRRGYGGDNYWPRQRTHKEY